MKLTGASLPRLGARDWALLTAQAAAGSVGYTVLLITGLQRASAVDAGIILGALPLVSAALAVTLLGERPGRSTLVAIAIATAGVWLTMASPAGPEGASSLTGNALVLGAVCCEGLFILLHAAAHAGAAARAVDHHDRHRPGCLGAGEPAGRGALDAGAARRRGAGRGLLRAGAHGGRLPAFGTRAPPAAMARKPRCSPRSRRYAPYCWRRACWARRCRPASSPAWPAYWRPSRCWDCRTAPPLKAHAKARTPSGAGRVRP